jgi:hypothetical protein
MCSPYRIQDVLTEREEELAPVEDSSVVPPLQLDELSVSTPLSARIWQLTLSSIDTPLLHGHICAFRFITLFLIKNRPVQIQIRQHLDLHRSPMR